MKNLLSKLTLILLSIGAASALSFSGIAQNSASTARATPGKTIVGYISDNHCGLKHMEGMDEKALRSDVRGQR